MHYAKNIGVISFRLAGNDGVSLETGKWVAVLENDLGHNCYYLAGELDTPLEKSMLLEEAHFHHPKNKEMYEKCFSLPNRPPELTRDLHQMREIIKAKLYQFTKKFDIQMFLIENALTIPLNIPLAMALTEYIAESGMPTIAHHHDFFWERKRFLSNCIWDYLNSCYPPHLQPIQHVVINSSGQNQLALRTGISASLVPNVMDFETPAPGIDDYNQDVRQELGIDQDELLVLQPTRVVQRKGIEHAIELVARLKRKSVLVISHASGDEGYEYQERVKDFAALLGIKAVFVDGRISNQRGRNEKNEKIYSLEDIYPHADLVTYPSLMEGFGNAFLEAVYFRKPVLVNNYSIYSHDIHPKGFQVVLMDNFISGQTVKEVDDLLDDAARQKEMTEKNYQLGLQYFSYKVLRESLRYLITRFFGREK